MFVGYGNGGKLQIGLCKDIYGESQYKRTRHDYFRNCFHGFHFSIGWLFFPGKLERRTPARLPGATDQGCPARNTQGGARWARALAFRA
jgi:hypothetical protein